MNAPPLTIGLPVYNGADYLELSLASIEEQTYQDYQVLISDNASTDGTEDICRAYASRDERVSYVRHERNMGGAWNFNFVFTESSSPYFKWITHDDLHAPGFLEAAIEAINAEPSAILAYPRTVLIDEDGEPIRDFADRLDLRSLHPHERLRTYLDNYEMSNAIFGVIRRPLMERTSLLGAYSSSDKVLMAEMAIAGQFIEIADFLFRRRYHEGMSRKANITPEEIAEWFDPNQPRPVAMTRTKLFVEYARSIASMPAIDARERVRCFRELVAAGGWHEMHVIGGELKREAKIGIERSRRRITQRFAGRPS